MDNSLNPVFISEGDDKEEILVVQIRVNNLPLRIINCYGPQITENEKKDLFWSRLQSEVDNALNENTGVIICTDGNLHCGEKIVPGDPNPQNHNGRLFEQFLEKNPELKLMNGTVKCQGVITRERIKGKKHEKSVLDFMLVSDNIEEFVTSMVIDEGRQYPLCSYLQGKEKPSDHFTQIMKMNISYQKQKPVREECFNFKSVVGQKAYTEMLDNESNLTKCFENDEDIDTQVEKWLCAFNQILNKSFPKIRVTEKVKETELTKLQKKRTELVQRTKLNPDNKNLKDELEHVIVEITRLVSDRNRDKIYEQFKKLDQSEGENFANGIWTLKKKEFPKKNATIPSAKTDPVSGKTVTNPEELKKLYLETFQHRLRNRPAKQSYSELCELEDMLCKSRLLITKHKKSRDWTEKEVVKAMKSLKSNKARDPLGFSTDIFKPPVAGTDLVKSLTLMMNKAKRECKQPEVMRRKNITAIFKGKGSRSALKNERGVFNCTILNSILQKLILNSNYETIDGNLSDANVGSRKNMNIRNNTFIINAVINEANTNKSKSSLDILIFDYRECFDSLNVNTTLNDLYNVGITSDHLNLIAECDSRSRIAVKTPVGITKPVDVPNIIAQGECMSSIKCTVSVDSISESHKDSLDDCKHSEESHSHLYQYKDKVPVPVLGMVDDQIAVAKCGLDSVMSSVHINSQTNIKRLQFGENKCFKLHIGKNKNVCSENVIDTWELRSDNESISSILEMLDEEGDQKVLLEVTNEKYLGDVIMATGSNSLNIKERMKRGYGAVNQIMQMLEELCLGHYYFETANVLRSSLLLSTLLSNSEAWYNVSKKDIENLEKVDEALLRKIFSAQCKTPLEVLYLESGNIPIQFILMSRRLNFLHYILNQPTDSLLRNVFDAQVNNPIGGDWVTQVEMDIKDLQLSLSFDQIRNIPKEQFKKIIKEKVKTKSFELLTKIQATHSKSKNIVYKKLGLQTYLSSDSSLTIKEKSFIFSARARMIDVKANFKVGKTNLRCRKCLKEEETQRHLLECPELMDNSVMIGSDIPKYEDLFSTDVDKVEVIGRILLQKFHKLVTPHCALPDHASAAT